MNNTVLDNGQLRVTISPRGAQMLSITDWQGYERLWSGDPAVWAWHAPNLFPVAGGLTHDQYHFEGRTYRMAKHGFSRDAAFALDAADSVSASFLLDTPMANYPFDYAFYVRYRLDGRAVRVTYEMVNRGRAPMYASAGAHEAYAFQGELAQWRLVFDRVERIQTRELAGSLLSGTRKLYAEASDTLPMREDMFYCDTMVFMDLQSRGVTFASDAFPQRVHVAYEGMDCLMVWKKPGAGFLCIEPWCNPPEPQGFDGDLTRKPGMIRIPAGGSASRTHVITFA